MDNEEALLWWRRRDERQRLAVARLSADGLVGANGMPVADGARLGARLDEARDWTLGPRRSRHFEDLSELGLLAARRQSARERAIALVEMNILRRWIAGLDAVASPTQCNELPIQGRPSACLRQPALDAQTPAACVDFAVSRSPAGPRRDAYELLCRDGVLDRDGNASIEPARLADRLEIAERVARDSLARAEWRARAAAEGDILRALARP